MNVNTESLSSIITAVVIVYILTGLIFFYLLADGKEEVGKKTMRKVLMVLFWPVLLHYYIGRDS